MQKKWRKEAEREACKPEIPKPKEEAEDKPLNPNSPSTRAPLNLIKIAKNAAPKPENP